MDEHKTAVSDSNSKYEKDICVLSADEIKQYLIRVLTGDPNSYDMSSWTWNATWSLKVNDSVTPWSLSIKQTYVLNSVEGDAHCNLSQKPSG